MGEGDRASPSLPLPGSFVFHKHKTWKWLRKMEPRDSHCLGREWVSRKHTAGVAGDLQLQPARWASVWPWEGAAAHRWEAGKLACVHSFCRSCLSSYYVLGSGLGMGSKEMKFQSREWGQHKWEMSKPGPLEAFGCLANFCFSPGLHEGYVLLS